MITVSWKTSQELKNRFLLSLRKKNSRDKRFFRHVILPPIFVLGFHSASRACWSQSFYCICSFWLFKFHLLWICSDNGLNVPFFWEGLRQSSVQNLKHLTGNVDGFWWIKHLWEEQADKQTNEFDWLSKLTIAGNIWTLTCRFIFLIVWPCSK